MSLHIGDWVKIHCPDCDNQMHVGPITHIWEDGYEIFMGVEEGHETFGSQYVLVIMTPEEIKTAKFINTIKGRYEI